MHFSSGLCCFMEPAWLDPATKNHNPKNRGNPAEVIRTFGKNFIPATQWLGVWFLGWKTWFSPSIFCWGKGKKVGWLFPLFFGGGRKFCLWCKIYLTGRYLCCVICLFLLKCFVGSLLCSWSACVGRLYHDYNGDRSATFSPQKPQKGLKNHPMFP